jgi:hypothetical protein
MTWTYLGGANAQATDQTANSLTCTYAGAIAAGDLIVVSVTFYNQYGGTIQISDFLVSSYTYIDGGYPNSGTFPINSFYAVSQGSASAGTFTVTATQINPQFSPWLSMTVDVFQFPGTGILYGIDSKAVVLQAAQASCGLPALTVYETDLVYIAGSMPNVGSIYVSSGIGFTLGQQVPSNGGSVTYSFYDLNRTSGVSPYVNASAADLTGLVGVAFNAVNFPLAAIAAVSSGQIGIAVPFTLQLNQAAPGGGATFNLSSSNGSDIFQPQQGWQNVTSVVIPTGSVTGSFVLVPNGSTGARTLTISSTTYTVGGSPFTFTASSGSAPNASIAISSTYAAGAYIGSSGQQLFAFFKSGTSGTGSVENPSIINQAPMIYQNGTLVCQGTNPLIVPGTFPYVSFNLPSGTTIAPGASGYQVTTQPAWVTMQSGDICNGVTQQAIANYAGQSCFGTGALAKTFKPGVNMSFLGPDSFNIYNVAKNWRLRLDASQAPFGNNTNITYQFTNCNWGNTIDSLHYPVPIGYWAVGFDDPNWATARMTVTIINQPTQPGVTVTPVTANSNPGTNGQGQYYLFQVVQNLSLATDLNIQLSIELYNSQSNPNIGMLGNLWIVGPGDFQVPTGSNPVSFDRTHPYDLSRAFLSRFPYGLGSMRWADSTLGFSVGSYTTQPWEETPLAALSWANSNYSGYTISYIAARPLNPPGVSGSTSYIYSAFLGSVASSLGLNGWASWTCSSTLGANITSTSQTAITFSSASSATNDPIFAGVVIQIDSEIMMIQSAYGALITVWRGANGTTAATHAAGATITILSKRWSWTSLSQLVGSAIQAVEFVCSAPHGLTEHVPITTGSGWPILTFTDNSTINPSSIPINDQGVYGPWITGPNTFAAYWTRASGTATTLSSTTSVSISVTWNPQIENGFPAEFIAMTTGSFAGADLHVNLPLMATDAYVWDVAAKIVANFPPGRRVFLEVGDEPWWDGYNGFYTGIVMSYQAGVPYNYFQVVTRTGQIRAIFRSAFGARASEIHAIVNMQNVIPTAWSNPTSSNYASTGPLVLAAYYNIPIDAVAIAPYIEQDSSGPTKTAWNNCSTIPQMIDLFTHDMYYNENGHPAICTAYNTLIAAYTAYSGNPCLLYGYEGGFSGIPNSANNQNTLGIDLPNDPLWVIAEQDFYAMLQRFGFTRLNIYSYSLYFSNDNNWGMYHGLAQPYGYGDGSVASDGKAYQNQTYHVTAGYGATNYAGTPATSWLTNTASVRGQAFVNWMGNTQTYYTGSHNRQLESLWRRMLEGSTGVRLLESPSTIFPLPCMPVQRRGLMILD